MFQPISPVASGGHLQLIRWARPNSAAFSPSHSTQYPHPQAVSGSARAPYRVLVTDDDARVRAIERLILERNGGVTVIDTGDSQEAITICRHDL
jgi:PleD family two-component response regulator